MYKVSTLAAVCVIGASGALAQVTESTQSGATGDSVYSVSVQGSDGRTYACKPNLENRNGQTVRVCRGTGAAAVTGGLSGELNGSTLGLIGLGLAALAIGSSSGTD